MPESIHYEKYHPLIPHNVDFLLIICLSPVDEFLIFRPDKIFHRFWDVGGWYEGMRPIYHLKTTGISLELGRLAAAILS